MKRIKATRRHTQIICTGGSRISNIRIDGELVVSRDPRYRRLLDWVKALFN